MKAVVVLEKGKLAVVDDCPMPEVGPYDALVRIDTCGFCNGTDTRIINEQMTREQGLRPYPTILGHEAAGVVVEVGEKVRNFKVGEKHMRIRGVNPEGNPYTATHGQMAEYGTIRDYKAMYEDGLDVEPRLAARLPDDFDMVDAGVLLSLCECLSAVKNFGINEKTDVLVYGAGPMGLAMMTYMKILGAKSVTCIDSVPERLDAALNIAKVDRVINYAQEDKAKALEGCKFDRVVDAVGMSQIILEGAKYLNPYGVVCCLGVLRKGDSTVDLSLFPKNILIHMLNFPYHEYYCLEENLDYIRRGLINPKDFYSHVLPMDEVQKAYELVMNKQTTKVILKVH